MPWGLRGMRGKWGLWVTAPSSACLWPRQWEYLSRASRGSTEGTPGPGRAMCHSPALLLLARTCEHLHAPWSCSWSQEQSLPFASSAAWQSKHRSWQQRSKSHQRSGCPMSRSHREEEEQGATGARGCLCLEGCWVKREKRWQKKVRVLVPGCWKTDG